ncbi:4Fe-4S dicluster domain-containing protein [bacterium]|nr:4Fe-4S dicluster domain-containing protein [bacterium]
MNNLAVATRQIMWNVPFQWLMYPLFIVSLISLGYGLYQQIARWRSGVADKERLSDYSRRLLFTVREILLQSRVRRSSIAGVFHSLFFYAFIIFIVTTAVIALDYDFGTRFFHGYVYLVLTGISDLAGLLFLLGLMMAFWRRIVIRPGYLATDRKDTVALLLLMVIILTGFMIEGLRIMLTRDPWAPYSPVGQLTGQLFGGISERVGLTLHAAIWWVHTACVMLWIATIPYTKFLHLLTLPANTFFRKTKPAGELKRVDLEDLMEAEDFDPEAFSIGLDTIADLSWKQRLNFDACISCGRCEENCPATASGLPLSPKSFIAGMKEVMVLDDTAQGESTAGEFESTEIMRNAFDENFSWYCRTCRACDEVCPAYVEHVDIQIEIRRCEVNMKGRMPEEVEQMLRQMETNGNPFGHQTERVKWTKSLKIPVIKPGESCEILYWIGCLSTFDPVKQQIAQDVITYLKNSGADFGILGMGEQCCGDPARVVGEENLFQMTAKQQVEELNSRAFKTLLVSCPHCYNVLKNEYPQFGGEFQVMHHTEYLATNGVSTDPGSSSENRTVVYHDPCYLGRYQGIYDAPRQVLQKLPNITIVTPDKSGWKSFCCGAGGGHFWMDFKADERINNLRIQQLKETGADTIVTACPYCHHMLEDSIKLMNLEEEIKVQDIVSMAISAEKLE